MPNSVELTDNQKIVFDEFFEQYEEQRDAFQEKAKLLESYLYKCAKNLGVDMSLYGFNLDTKKFEAKPAENKGL